MTFTKRQNIYTVLPVLGIQVKFFTAGITASIVFGPGPIDSQLNRQQDHLDDDNTLSHDGTTNTHLV